MATGDGEWALFGEIPQLYAAGEPIALRQFATAAWGREAIVGQIAGELLGRLQQSSEVEDILSEDWVYRLNLCRLAATGTSEIPKPQKLYDVLTGLGKGQSFIAENLERFLGRGHPLRELADALEGATGHPLKSITVLVSPPAAQMFTTHSDREHTLTLQLKGRKTWRLYCGEKQSELIQKAQHVLQAGHFLYVPAGMAHKVESLEEVSVSVALVFEPIEKKLLWDFLTEEIGHANLAGCLQCPVTAAHRQPLEVLLQTIIEELRRSLEEIDVRQLATFTIDRAERMRRSPTKFRWDHITVPVGEHRYRLASRISRTIREAADALYIPMSQEYSFRAPNKVKDELLWILAQDGDFGPEQIPTNLSRASLQRLLRRLRDAGVLTRA